MKVLGIETSTERGSVALVEDGKAVAELAHAHANRHAEELLPLLDELLARAGHGRQALDMVAVGIGPGSFTGLRVGVALASGIGLGLGIPVVGVPSLVALAHGLRLRYSETVTEQSPDWLGALVDARRGEFFFSAFSRELDGTLDTQLLNAQQLEHELDVLIGQRSIWIAGECAQHLLPPRWLPPAAPHETEPMSALSRFPSALCVALLAHSAHATHDVAPLYLRDADAKLPNLPPNPLRNRGS